MLQVVLDVPPPILMNCYDSQLCEIDSLIRLVPKSND